MATIIDPLGTPSVVYNRSGTVLIAIDAAGLIASTGAAIPNVCGHTIVVATWIGVDDQAVVLPSSADIGDIVEIFAVGGETVRVFAPTGETVAAGVIFVENNKGCRCIKMSSTNWYPIF